MKLNIAQKRFLFETIFENNLREIYKIFDTISINWLVKQKLELADFDQFGWAPLLMDGIEYTRLNFDKYGLEKGWDGIWTLK